jgi:hypothetical protein
LSPVNDEKFFSQFGEKHKVVGRYAEEKWDVSQLSTSQIEGTLA